MNSIVKWEEGDYTITRVLVGEFSELKPRTIAETTDCIIGKNDKEFFITKIAGEDIYGEYITKK